MSSDILLSKFWGWLLTLVCGAYILRPSICKKVLKMMEDERFVIVTAWFSLILGVGTAVGSSTAPLKALGITFTLNGLLRLSFPDKLAPVSRLFREKTFIPLGISLLGFITGIYFILNSQPHLLQET